MGVAYIESQSAIDVRTLNEQLKRGRCNVMHLAKRPGVFLAKDPFHALYGTGSNSGEQRGVDCSAMIFLSLTLGRMAARMRKRSNGRWPPMRESIVVFLMRRRWVAGRCGVHRYDGPY